MDLLGSCYRYVGTDSIRILHNGTLRFSITLES